MRVKLSHTQIIALGFLILIGLGTLLLSLPIATADGTRAPLLTTLFTAVSASCVTGLVPLGVSRSAPFAFPELAVSR